MRPTGARAPFEYDGNLKRVYQTLGGKNTYSVYGRSGALIYRANLNDASKTTDYIRVAGKTAVRIKGSGPTYSETYPHQDHLGSRVAETDISGAITWREDYTPYGEKRLDPAGNRDNEGFTGHIDDDASGLTYMQARYYDPVIGRFLSNDPVAFSPDQPQMFNRYSYTLNDPVNATDPTGKCPWCVFGAFVGAISEGVAIYNDVKSERNVSFAEGALRVAGSAAIGFVGGGAGAVLSKGVAQVGAKVATSAVTKAASVATKMVGNAAIGGAANGTNTAARREVQIAVTGSSEISNSDIRSDIGRGAIVGTGLGEAAEFGLTQSPIAGAVGDLSPTGAAAAQGLAAVANILITNPDTLKSDD